MDDIKIRGAKMLKVQEIRELIKLVDQSNIDEFVYEHEGSKIRMKKNAQEVVTVSQARMQPTAEAVHIPKIVQQAAVEAEEKPAAGAQEAIQEISSNLHKIISPMVGTFYQSSSPESESFVNVGAKVSKDSIVCIVEAMKLYNEIEAEVNGEIVEVLVKNGQLVEYGQPLFLVKPE